MDGWLHENVVIHALSGFTYQGIIFFLNHLYRGHLFNHSTLQSPAKVWTFIEPLQHEVVCKHTGSEKKLVFSLLCSLFPAQ